MLHLIYLAQAISRNCRKSLIHAFLVLPMAGLSRKISQICKGRKQIIRINTVSAAAFRVAGMNRQMPAISSTRPDNCMMSKRAGKNSGTMRRYMPERMKWVKPATIIRIAIVNVSNFTEVGIIEYKQIKNIGPGRGN
jgi:hypothetical protein